MEVENLLQLRNRSELRQWLKDNHNEETYCWVVTYRGNCPLELPAIPYLEVVKGLSVSGGYTAPSSAISMTGWHNVSPLADLIATGLN